MDTVRFYGRSNRKHRALWRIFGVFLILLLTTSATLAANFYATRLEVSDRVIEEKTKTLALQAIKDNLTGLFNRTALTKEIEK
ncbi:hypothetical protein QW180_26745 [Vibrio sinaloensis]|nr:hypothetical protein [Vibrio sinaloensis]